MSYFRPPTNDDAERAQLGRLMHWILISTVLMSAVATAALSLTPGGFAAVGYRYALAGSGLFVCFVVLHHGGVRAAARGFLIFGWLAAMGASVVGGGLAAPAVSAVLLITLLAGFLWSGRAAVGLAVLSVLGFVAMYLGHRSGNLALEAAEPGRYFLAMLVMLVLGAAFVSVSLRSLRQAHARELAESERALEDARREQEAGELARHTERLRAVGQLAGGIAHDFNNLLMAVGGNLELLDVDGPRSDELSAARDAVDRGASLTRQILAVGQRQRLDPRPIDVNQLTLDLEPEIRGTLGDAIELELRPTDELWACNVDADQLVAAIMNLVHNARDAMPGGGRLTLETANTSFSADDTQVDVFPGDYVVFSVSDTGCGMTEDVAERAFEPFFSTRGLSGGRGLGLSMVYGFVRQTGGDVRIESVPGHGSTVRLFLPRSDAAAPDGVLIAAPDPPPATRHILLVEDDPAIRRLAARLIDRLGHECTAFGNAEEALAWATDRRPDLLFTDVVLQGDMSGPELATRVLARWPDVPVLYTSGYPEESIVGGRPEGPFRLLEKPYRFADLAAKLDEALGA